MKFWSDKRVIVTGGSGFLGTHVVDALRERGCRHIVVPRSNDYDLRHQANVIRLYRAHRADMVLHLAAAVGGIGANRSHPGSFFYDNLMMGVQLMEYARQFEIPKFVAVGTICAYPKFTPVPFREEDLWSGYPEETNAPYGLAKKMLLVQSEAYRQEYDYNSIYLLPVNLYGPGDNFDLETSHVIPAIIRRCLEAKEADAPSIRLWGDGSPTREFLYATDAAEGILKAAEHYNDSASVNIGSGHEISIHELADEIKALTGYTGEIVWDTEQPNGQPRRCLDVSRAKQKFGFESQVGLKEGLKRTLEWYQNSLGTEAQTSARTAAD
ncbi:MAG: GDP-fucose synthetase [Gemmatimonadetes bacterium]|nr:GDP-fucose synthetase [Gemmatimonadota bacterium]